MEILPILFVLNHGFKIFNLTSPEALEGIPQLSPVT
jgi:hypothetical protein